MELRDKEVRFDRYCKDCTHRFDRETTDPCNDCLDMPVKRHSAIPIHWERKRNHLENVQ